MSSAVESARAPSRDVSFCNRLLLNRDGDGDRPNKYSSIHTYIYSMEQYDELISILGSVTKYEGAIHRKMNSCRYHLSYSTKLFSKDSNEWSQLTLLIISERSGWSIIISKEVLYVIIVRIFPAIWCEFNSYYSKSLGRSYSNPNWILAMWELYCVVPKPDENDVSNQPLDFEMIFNLDRSKPNASIWKLSRNGKKYKTKLFGMIQISK